MGFCDEKTAREKLSSIDDQVEDKEFVSKLATGLKAYAEKVAIVSFLVW